MAKTATSKTSKQGSSKLQRFLPWILIIGATIALICSFIIMSEKLEVLENPNHSTVCDINPVISCGSVMRSDQANAFGFPNPIIGLVGFPILITIGFALLAGAQLKRWFWVGAQLGTLFAAGFIHWLFYQSVYNINALCLFCMTVWAVVMPMFWYLLLYNLREGHIKLPKGWGKFGDFLQRHHLDILITWYIVIAALILKHFWYYFGTLI